MVGGKDVVRAENAYVDTSRIDDSESNGRMATSHAPQSQYWVNCCTQFTVNAFEEPLFQMQIERGDLSIELQEQKLLDGVDLDL